MNTAISNANKAIVLFASPNKNGNTYKLYSQLQDKLNLDTKIINVYDCTIAPCIDCKACYENECPFNNDDMGIIIDEILNSSIIICATPIYFNGVPAPFKAIIDRCQQFFVKKVILNNPVFKNKRMGILLTTAGCSDNNATVSIYEVFKMFFSCINVDFIEHIAITNTDNITEYQIDQSSIQNIMNIIQNKMEDK